MIDFDETGLYKGFVRNQKGKKFPGRNPQLLSLQEVDADEEPNMKFYRISSMGKDWLAI